ncbi:hypothetical protein FOL47_006575 [Perkinsus chesapeaki]|uniref:phosphoinositide 5-phosphatase n=1 Tax=Perkinsus chesapeaki TaxID=330153 RepID=A0A7J6MXQ7_PERCH|nr:hypothetical protein FOL47_006575 [Perkinsus chesapeaki]
MEWTPDSWPESIQATESGAIGGWPPVTEEIAPTSTGPKQSHTNRYNIAICEKSIVIRHGTSHKGTLVLDNRKVGNVHVVQAGRHKDMVIDEIQATAILGTVVCPTDGKTRTANRSYLVACTEANPVAKLPGGNIIMEVQNVKCIPYRPARSQQNPSSQATGMQGPSAVAPMVGPSIPSMVPQSDGDMLPDIISKRVERLFSGGGFYYCPTYDITHGQQWHAEHYCSGQGGDHSIWDTADPLYCWNRAMVTNMIGQPTDGIDLDEWCTPLMQGSVCGPCTVADGYDVMLIGRRSCERSGTRYHHRGIDDEGHVANYVETEMLVIKEGNEIVAAHTQIRGSVPAFWQQQGSTMKLDITRNANLSASAYDKHIKGIMDRYGPQGCLFVNLLATGKGQEQRLTDALKEIMKASHFADDGVFSIIDFDFHKMVKEQGMDVDTVLDTIVSSGKAKALEFQWWQPTVDKKQNGVVRTNCLDCLDRTNAGQLAFSCFILREILTGLGVKFNDGDVKKVLTNLWAQHGDQIAMHYTGTGSVLTELVTTGQNSWQNSIQQRLRSANRYVKNNFGEDRDRQSAIDASLTLKRGGTDKKKATKDNNKQQLRAVTAPDLVGIGDSILEYGSSSNGDDDSSEPSSPTAAASPADGGSTLTIWAGTWNINASRAWNTEDLSDWFRLATGQDKGGGSSLRDVYIIGMQEFVDLDATAIIKRGFKMMTSKFEGETEHEVRKAEFNRALDRLFDTFQKREGIPRQDRVHYTEVQCITMVGLYISVWVKESLVREISHVHTKKIKGGLGGAHGNKGGVLLSMKLHNTLISVCSVHLEAGDRMMDVRNDQLSMITSEYRQQVREQYANIQPIRRRALFIIGDFNFRLNCGRETALALLDKGDFDHKPVSATFKLSIDLPTIRSPVRVKRRPAAARRSDTTSTGGTRQNSSRLSSSSSVPEVDLLSWVSEPEQIKHSATEGSDGPPPPSLTNNLMDDYFGPFESATSSSADSTKLNKLVNGGNVVVDNNFFASPAVPSQSGSSNPQSAPGGGVQSQGGFPPPPPDPSEPPDLLL